jgi:hypothetical protein
MKTAALLSLAFCLGGALSAQAQTARPEPEPTVFEPAQISLLTPLPEGLTNDLGNIAQRLKATSAAIMTLQGEEIDAAPTAAQTTAASATQCAGGKAALTDGWRVFAYTLNRSAAVELGIFANADLAASDKVIVYHYMWFGDRFDADDQLIGRCGSGIQLALRTSDASVTAAVSLPSIAATTQLGMTSVSYTLSTFGISGTAIDAAAPEAGAVGKFDTESYAALIASITAIQKAGRDNVNVTWSPRVVAMDNLGAASNGVRRTMVELVALRHIARGVSCQNARNAVPGRNSESDGFVTSFYQSFVRASACNFGTTIRQDERDRAISELTRYGLPVT